MSRYVDDSSYGRPRESTRRDDPRRGVDPRDPRDPRDSRYREERDVRITRDPRHGREPRDPRDPRDLRDPRIMSDYPAEDMMDTRMDTRMDTTMDTRMDPRIDHRMEHRMDTRSDPRMDMRLDSRLESSIDSRPEPRANTHTRITRGPAPEVMYKDVQSGQLYQDIPTRRLPYDDEPPEIESRKRPMVTSPSVASSGGPNPPYNEFWISADGIDREVIQRDICMWLGSDALCRPNIDKDGKRGYTIKAYRTLTSAMVKSLKEATAKHQAENDKRRRQGRQEVSYSENHDAQPTHIYDDVTMDDDDPRYAALPRSGRDYDPRDPRDPRAQMASTRRILPPTSGYMMDPGYPASQYPLPSAPPSGLTMQYEPRYPGNTTPPAASMRPSTAGYPQGYPPQGYPRVSQAAAPPSMMTPSYRDPGPERMPPSQYPSDRPYRR